jgi:hypothetical protein
VRPRALGPNEPPAASGEVRRLVFVLLLSFGLWALIWGAVSLLALGYTDE